MSAKSHQKHILVVEDDQGRREVTLEESSYSLGRDAKCKIRLLSQFVSRYHANIFRRTDSNGNQYYQIVDGDANGKPSVNGLMINGHKMDVRDLEDEDEVVFGPQVKVIYYLQKADTLSNSEPLDEFDITLISPGMLDDFDM
jgi:pSer/pThr/pTyr-binding forkhead associated (FHA) protein